MKPIYAVLCDCNKKSRLHDFSIGKHTTGAHRIKGKPPSKQNFKQLEWCNLPVTLWPRGRHSPNQRTMQKLQNKSSMTHVKSYSIHSMTNISQMD